MAADKDQPQPVVLEEVVIQFGGVRGRLLIEPRGEFGEQASNPAAAGAGRWP